MDHQWRSHPIQGNICPTCSISHFPFCPPPPHHTGYPGPSFDPGLGSMIIARPIYHDPGYWNRNPSFPQTGDFGTANKDPYSMQNPGYSEYNADDRGIKRLRVDGVYPGSYTGGIEGDGNLLTVPLQENERILKLIHDHGGPNSDFGFNRDMRGYVQESLVFERNVDAQDHGISNNIGMRNNPDMGYGVNYQGEEIGYQPGFGSHCGIKRRVSHLQDGSYGNKFQNIDHQLPQYGEVEKPPDHAPFHRGMVGHDKEIESHGYPHSSYGSSHAPNESFYGNNFEPRHPNNASMYHSPSQPGQMRYGYHSPSHFNDVRQPFEVRARPIEGYQGPFGNQNVPVHPHYGPANMDNQRGYDNSVSENTGYFRASQGFDVRPPLPASPPPPLPMEPPGQWSSDQKPLSSPTKVSASLFPIAASSSASIQSSYAPTSEFHMRAHPHRQSSHTPRSSRDMFLGDSQATLTSSGHYLRESQRFPSKNSFPDRSKIIDASHLFKPLHRANRPDHFVIILRGLPGSGKSYIAKMLRDLEVEHGGNAPRIHSMDDYFIMEVEKAEENEASKSSVRGKKPTMKKVLEYCYEPEMEEAYRASMLKAFKKTLEEGAFTFVIVDDRNLRVADFAQFWATAKRSGYEVYVLEAPYKDPAGCTARNVHGFTQDDVEKMAAQWEEAPSLYLQLDVKSLFHGDDLAECNIQEVDMDMEDGGFEGGIHRLEEKEPEKIVASSGGGVRPDASPKDERGWDARGENPTEEVKDLGRSKWSSNLDEEDDERSEVLKTKPNVLSGLLKTYGKEGKSVHWGDQGGHTGFSIGAVKKANTVSLVIGPGAGYNLKSNPMPEEEAQASAKSGETRKHSVFKERLRAEQESFRAVFDRRRQRIGGLDAEEQ